METGELIKAYINKNTVAFNDIKDSTLITRNVVYSFSIHQKEMCEYFLTSISQNYELTVSHSEPCICYFDSQEL